ncbi:PREDICTED: ankyrin-3-like, partial [Amphimedon queenslandica]|uniref:Uncharacterized protein n=1 Tax=Amphimedon queenslandica TaxID=400682 RepID=A0AAN0JTK4_AMPQE
MDNRGCSLLHKACEGGHVPVVLYLTSLPQCNVVAKTSNGSTVLHITCEYSDSLPILKYLVENQQLDLCAVNDEGMAPIHLACIKGRLNLIQYIIEHIPSSLELPHSKHGHTPFLIAVYFNQLEVIKYLISKKCNLSATDGGGSGAVHISVERGHLNVLKYLIDNYYCNPNATNHQDRTPLHFAVAAKQFEILEYLLEIEPCLLINAQDKDGHTPLHFACMRGQQKMVSLLTSSTNINILINNKKGQTPLHLAAASGHKDTAKALLFSVTGSSTHHDLLTATDNEGSTVLHTACSNGHIDVFNYLSSIYPQGVNVMDNRGCSLLHKACEGGHVPVVLYLTGLPQCNVAAKTSNGSTVLHITCEYSDSLPILKHLVENHQLDLFAVNDEGMAPIHLACSNGRLNLIQYIIEHLPSSLELLVKGHGHTPFLTAVLFNQLEVIKYLISKKCNLSATDDEGSGAVHISVERGHLNVLKYLIDNNYCNPNATDHQDRTPLHVAVADDKYEILEYLLSKSIPSMSVVWLREIKYLLDSPHDIYNNPHNAVLINVQDKDGNTPLHVACQRGRQNMVSLLLKASLSNNNLLITNKKGQTPLHLAAASGHKDTAEALLFSVTGSSTHHDLLTATDNE